MLTSNRVARLTAVGQMTVVQEPVPEPKREEMLVKIEAAGICGSDLHYFRHGGLGSFKVPLPMALGHEPAGTVVNPNGHEGFRVGDRVAIEPGRPSLTSRWSLRGRHNLCKEGCFMGAQGHPGCFSDYVCVAPMQCCKLPPTLGFEAAALLEPVSVAMHCLELAGTTFRDTVTILGSGTIGLCLFLMLRRAGVKTIYMTDRLPFRRRFAVDFGATAAFSSEEAMAKLMSCTGGKGCSLVFDTAGTDESFDTAIRCAAVGARVVLVAIPEADFLKYNPHQARTREIQLLNPHRAPMILADAMALFEDVEAAAMLDRLVTHRLPLEDAQRAFEMAAGYSDGVIKIALKPDLPRPRRLDRVGLLGAGVAGPCNDVTAYLDALKSGGVEVCFAACWETELCTADRNENASRRLEDECDRWGIPFLGGADICRDADRLAEFGCDLVILAGDRSISEQETVVLQQFAREGVVRTHWGLLPRNPRENPIMWALLEAHPHGATTHFVQPGENVDDSIIDIFSLDDLPSRTCAAAVGQRLSIEALRRVPAWLAALRSGVFDMSAMPAIKLGRRSSGRQSLGRTLSRRQPNDAYVSWTWRCEFLQRFSDALGRVRARIDGADLWFIVDTTACVDLDALPEAGGVLSVARDGACFVVRASDGLVTCHLSDFSLAPIAAILKPGHVLESVEAQPLDGIIPMDFKGKALVLGSMEDGQFAPPPPDPLPEVMRKPSVAKVQQRSERELTIASMQASPKSDSGGDRGTKGPLVATTSSATAKAMATSAEPGAHIVCETKLDSAIARTVPIYDLRFDDDFVAEFQAKSAEVLTSGRPLSESKFCRDFEAAFARLVQAPMAVVTSSGTMALHIALRAIGVRGKTVITPSNTFFATQVAVENAGGRVLFAECERAYMQLCPSALRRQLSEQPAGSVAAVVLVHIGGIIAPFAAELREIAHASGAKLVEDAAHAHTSHLDGVGWAGTIGDIAAFSMFPTKVMTSGEGGMITTTSEELHRACREIKMFGAQLGGGSSRFTCGRADGTNGRVSELTGLLGLLDCSRVQQRVSRRQELVEEYCSGLAKCNAYQVLKQASGSCSYYKCIVRLHGDVRREYLREFAKARGVSFTGEVYHLGVHKMPPFEIDHSVALPVTDEVCAGHVCPPLYPEMSLDDVRYVCQVMLEAAAEVATLEGGEHAMVTEHQAA
eukprot:TRINITY_DN27440_c0_g1_i1.p1 TRINITY_DN27440_c0_g1~~TRINITY_DN27440_c0_g1_i1.p1  ORF type:complete len:1187 (-),score=182.11 TRINITY_DN27440_c0_g1_i1:220-3780(-)